MAHDGKAERVETQSLRMRSVKSRAITVVVHQPPYGATGNAETQLTENRVNSTSYVHGPSLSP